MNNLKYSNLTFVATQASSTDLRPLLLAELIGLAQDLTVSSCSFSRPDLVVAPLRILAGLTEENLSFWPAC